jgi:23S rRNA pseudoU1915 N3-methylase RlmH
MRKKTPTEEMEEETKHMTANIKEGKSKNNTARDFYTPRKLEKIDESLEPQDLTPLPRTGKMIKTNTVADKMYNAKPKGKKDDVIFDS